MYSSFSFIFTSDLIGTETIHVYHCIVLAVIIPTRRFNFIAFVHSHVVKIHTKNLINVVIQIVSLYVKTLYV